MHEHGEKYIKVSNSWITAKEIVCFECITRTAVREEREHETKSIQNIKTIHSRTTSPKQDKYKEKHTQTHHCETGANAKQKRLFKAKGKPSKEQDSQPISREKIRK